MGRNLKCSVVCDLTQVLKKWSHVCKVSEAFRVFTCSTKNMQYNGSTTVTQVCLCMLLVDDWDGKCLHLFLMFGVWICRQMVASGTQLSSVTRWVFFQGQGCSLVSKFKMNNQEQPWFRDKKSSHSWRQVFQNGLVNTSECWAKNLLQAKPRWNVKVWPCAVQCFQVSVGVLPAFWQQCSWLVVTGENSAETVHLGWNWHCMTSACLAPSGALVILLDYGFVGWGLVQYSDPTGAAGAPWPNWESKETSVFNFCFWSFSLQCCRWSGLCHFKRPFCMWATVLRHFWYLSSSITQEAPKHFSLNCVKPYFDPTNPWANPFCQIEPPLKLSSCTLWFNQPGGLEKGKPSATWDEAWKQVLVHLEKKIMFHQRIGFVESIIDLIKARFVVLIWHVWILHGHSKWFLQHVRNANSGSQNQCAEMCGSRIWYFASFAKESFWKSA